MTVNEFCDISGRSDPAVRSQIASLRKRGFLVFHSTVQEGKTLPSTRWALARKGKSLIMDLSLAMNVQPPCRSTIWLQPKYQSILGELSDLRVSTFSLLMLIEQGVCSAAELAKWFGAYPSNITSRMFNARKHRLVADDPVKGTLYLTNEGSEVLGGFKELFK